MGSSPIGSALPSTRYMPSARAAVKAHHPGHIRRGKLMISNTTKDLELIQLETRMGTAEGNITTLGLLAGTANINALAAIDLANQKSWILFFKKPLRSDISSNVYIKVMPRVH